MTDDLYEGHCVAGCQMFHGGETRHHPSCGHYPESLTKFFADRIEALEAENARLREALEWYGSDRSGLFEPYRAIDGGRRARAALEGGE